jgi:ABC-type uncharacterized transport system auxiliary subunit
MRWALIAVLVLAGCGSSPTVDYYTLSMDPSGRTEPVVNLTVERFGTIDALARSQLMIAASATRIDYYADASWVSGVGELVQRKLQAEFGEPTEGRPSYLVGGTVTALEQVDVAGGAEARLEIEAVVRDASSKRYEDPVLVQTFSATRRADAAAPDAVVEALSACAEEIASEIARAVSEL